MGCRTCMMVLHKARPAKAMAPKGVGASSAAAELPTLLGSTAKENDQLWTFPIQCGDDVGADMLAVIDVMNAEAEASASAKAAASAKQADAVEGNGGGENANANASSAAGSAPADSDAPTVIETCEPGMGLLENNLKFAVVDSSVGVAGSGCATTCECNKCKLQKPLDGKDPIPSFVCKQCNCKRVQCSQIFGTWPIDLFTMLPEDQQISFWRNESKGKRDVQSLLAKA